MTEIGKTRSGKVIFAEAKAYLYRVGWTGEDHLDASKLMVARGLTLDLGSDEENENYRIQQSHAEMANKMLKLKRPKHDI